MTSLERKNYAHIVPFAAFMVIALVFQFAETFGLKLDNEAQPWFRRRPEYLMMLMQMAVCFPLLIHWRKEYEWNVNRGWVLGLIAGVVGISIWILPTHLYTALNLGIEGVDDPAWYRYLGLAERSEGFDAAIFVESPTWYWTTIVLRFVRAALLVALIEEIFWRGFLMRFLLKSDGNYWKVPFGDFSWVSYCIVTVMFMAVHSSLDWLGAFAFGSIMFFVAVRTKSLFACIFMHFVANLLMGWYAFESKKFGLW